MLFFFFSSRRRHTRWPRDWSSDVCSSDLALVEVPQLHALRDLRRRATEDRGAAVAPGHRARCRRGAAAGAALPAAWRALVAHAARSDARTHGARPDADADRSHPAFLRHAVAAEH